MAGIAFSLARRSGQPVRALTRTMLQYLRHRGTEQLICAQDFSIGICESGPVPTAGRAQSDLCQMAKLLLAFDGRIDNRRALESLLPGPAVTTLSDAQLLLQLYVNLGLHGVSNVRGPFVAVLRDARRGSTHLLRDPVGGRRLVYSLTPSRLLVSTEMDALIGATQDLQLDEMALVHVLSGGTLPTGRTMYQHAREVAPGAVVSVTDTHDATHTLSSLRPSMSEHTNESDWQAEFRHLLRQSVACRLQRDADPHIMMSGGVDSTLVAALAGADSDKRVNTWSWRFRRFADCDEQTHINAMQQSFQFNQQWVDVDANWPLRRPQRLLDQDGVGPLNPFRDIKQKLYNRAVNGGAKVLLTGCFGDHLYAQSGYWFRDLLRHGKGREAINSLSRHMRELGVTGWWPGQVARSTLGISHINLRPRGRANWLNQSARDLLCDANALRTANHYRPQQTKLLLGNHSATSHSGEHVNAARAGLEIRHPYRDWRLIEHVLSVPEYALYRPSEPKRLARQAAANLLPDIVLDQSNKANLLSFYQFGHYHSGGIWRHQADRLAANHFSSVLSADWHEQLTCKTGSENSKMLLWIIRSSAFAVEASHLSAAGRLAHRQDEGINRSLGRAA